MTKYRLIPRQVEAVQWTGTNISEIERLCGEDTHVRIIEPSSSIIIRHQDNLMSAYALDFVLKHGDGRIEVLKPYIFRETYQEPDCTTYEDGYEAGYTAATLDAACRTCPSKCPTTEPEKPKEMVNHPDHYLTNGKECIDGMEQCFSPEAVEGWLECSAYKYLWRKGNKGPAETDIRKAQWCVDRYNRMTGSALDIDTIMRAIEKFVNS